VTSSLPCTTYFVRHNSPGIAKHVGQEMLIPSFIGFLLRYQTSLGSGSHSVIEKTIVAFELGATAR
jgi:hypothetical protein